MLHGCFEPLFCYVDMCKFVRVLQVHWHNPILVTKSNRYTVTSVFHPKGVHQVRHVRPRHCIAPHCNVHTSECPFGWPLVENIVDLGIEAQPYKIRRPLIFGCSLSKIPMCKNRVALRIPPVYSLHLDHTHIGNRTMNPQTWMGRISCRICHSLVVSFIQGDPRSNQFQKQLLLHTISISTIGFLVSLMGDICLRAHPLCIQIRGMWNPWFEGSVISFPETLTEWESTPSNVTPCWDTGIYRRNTA